MTDVEIARTTADPEGSDQSGVDRSQGDPRANTGQAVPAVLVHVDPSTLVIEANARTQVVLDKPFVGSIRDHGVLVPIVARRVGEELRVRMGQRRTLAAVEAGRTSVPVYVIEAADEGKAAEIERIVCQLVENTHRAGLPEVDKVGAHQQLALLGLAAGQIARRTRTKPAEVKASLQVAGSEVALAAMGRYELTVDQAAGLAEFAGDAEAVKVLTVTARSRPEQFGHVLQRLRDEAAEATARQALLAELSTAGVPVVDQHDYVYGEKTVLLEHLRPSAEAEPGTELAAADHAACAGHAAFLDSGRWGSGDGLTAVFVCTDWRANGHARRNAPAGEADSGVFTAARPAGPMSEEQKAERRRVIANNKAWDSATTVRRDWLRAFLARRSAPKDAPAWIAATLAAASREVCKALESGHPQACDLLGLTTTDHPYHYRAGSAQHPIATAAGRATPARATMLTLAMLLGGLEQSTDRYTWRTPTTAHRAYFTALDRWGYPLSDVEKLVLDEPETATASPGEGTDEPDETAHGDDAEPREDTDVTGGDARSDEAA